MKEINKNTEVMIAMSGGLDSSVAAILLREQGYIVKGITMHLYDDSNHVQADSRTTERARSVAQKLSIPFEVIDLREEFKKKIVGYFKASHELGITPNPCFVCNQQIKWGLLLDEVLKKGVTWLASGHYAQLKGTTDGRVELFRAKDLQKDQSYVLAGLKQEQLTHAVFPLGNITKWRAKEIAHSYNIDFSDIGESQDLCFLDGMSQEEYLSGLSPDLFQPGEIRTIEGERLGEHNGLANYTIGQRKGLGSGNKEPIYVLHKDVHSNTLIVGGKQSLGVRKIRVTQLNWISGNEPELPDNFEIKIRYKSNPHKAHIRKPNESGCDIIFENPVRDPTPGQYAVFYQGEKVIGSGVITEICNGVDE